MRFGTLCSGIEGASVAFDGLGWSLQYVAEIDPFCCALLEHHYPGVTNYGDITAERAFPAVDLIVSGTPCQSFSVGGNRRGTDDARGQLALRFVEILRESRPSWFVWENVPGVLSSNGGRDFGALLWQMGQLGYGLAYRVLDAQFFGVAQRRRRVFLVGNRRGWQRAAAVLFDDGARRPNAPTIAEVLARRDSAGEGAEEVYGFTGDTTPKFGEHVTPTLRAYQGGEGVGILNGDLRRLTCEEWEMLQGFPVGYTDIDGATDTLRRRALGNSFCVPVMRWIGQRIRALNEWD